MFSVGVDPSKQQPQLGYWGAEDRGTLRQLSLRRQTPRTPHVRCSRTRQGRSAREEGAAAQRPPGGYARGDPRSRAVLCFP